VLHPAAARTELDSLNQIKYLQRDLNVAPSQNSALNLMDPQVLIPKGFHPKGVQMSVLATIGICWLGANGALAVALLNRCPRAIMRAKLFRWVIRHQRPGRHEPVPGTSHA
jgi:hypothetical protein